MIKKIIWAGFFLLCFNYTGLCQFNITISYGDVPSADPHSSYEGEIKHYNVGITLTQPLPDNYNFVVTVNNGAVVQQYLVPGFPPAKPVPLYVDVQWACNVLSGTITVSESKSGISATYSTAIVSYLNSTTYCTQISPAKQNLHYPQKPALITVTNCSPNCHPSGTYQYQWQVGDVPVGVFPQVPTTWTDIPYSATNPANGVSYLPPNYYFDCIKAYRRKTTFTGGVRYSDIAVISTFGDLSPGVIGGGTTFNNGVPVIWNTAATGGLCDGYAYGYTWQFSTDNSNWTEPGTGQSYPGGLQIPGPCYIRRKVDCGGETMYSNTLYINPVPINAGTITNSGASTVPFNTFPSITQTPASGSACNAPDYVYTWERSINNGPWLSFGTNTAGYPAGAGIVGTCKIRRKVHCVYEDAFSNELSFTMLPYTSPNAENLNYIRTNDIVIPGVHSWEQADALQTGDKLQSTTYLDGFGRATQSVTKQGSFIASATGQGAENNINNYQDLVSYTAYDGLGRADKGFLPYATTTNLGFFKTNAAAEQQSFNNQKYGEPANSIYTYSQTTYDGSPLNRVTNVKLPGAVLNNDVNYQGISSDYDFNSRGENVIMWEIGFNAGDKPIWNGLTYDANTLIKSITTDEKGKSIITYADLSGRTILKRVQVTDNAAFPPTGDDAREYLSTYYVFDDFGRLRYTITPKAVEALLRNNWDIDDDIKKGLCFYQEYDNRGRVTVKHSPDGGEVWLVYDNRDRLVLSQDENQRSRINLNPAKANQWSFSLYDENDRVLTTGLINDSRNRNDMQALVDGLVPKNQQVQIYAGAYETLTAYNPVIIKVNATDIFINSISYYDDYSHRPINQKSVNLTANDFATTTNKYVEQPVVSMSRMRGAATVSKVRKLTANYDNESSTATQFLTSTTYYDAKGQVVQSYGDNIKGGVDASAVLYDFAGKVLCTRGKHNMPNNDFDNLLVITKNDYDILGRATRLWKLYTKNSADISDATKYKKLSEVKLDEFGRGKTKTIGEDLQNPGTPLETMDFSYNMQGKLTGVNKDYALATAAGSMNNQWTRRFGFYLGYENTDNNFANKQYNGSITGVIWRSQGDNTQRKYDYEYDNINRFKAANFTQKDGGTSGAWGIALVDLSASVSDYDANGNIMGMVQKGIVPGTKGGVELDNLQYQYVTNSNQLLSVTDQASNVYSGKQGDFVHSSSSLNYTYDYDNNGNLKNDPNKNIASATGAGIISNFLDLPQTITIKDKSKTEYTYDASGNKLAKTVTQLTPNAPAPVTTWYIGGFVYEETSGKTELRYILNEEGKLRITDVTPVTTPANVIQVGITANVDFGIGPKQGVWDYYLKDNLGNTRMVLTEEGQMQVMKCTMEGNLPPTPPTPLQTEEEANFGSATNNEVAATRTTGPVPGWNSNTSKASKLQPAVGTGTAIGPNAILKVMAGDIINARADYFYQAAAPQQQNTNLLDNIAQSLLGSISGSTSVNSGVKAGVDLTYLQGGNTPIQPFLNDYHPATTGNQPRAYLNYIFFDEQFRYVPDCSGAKMVEVAGDGHGPLFNSPGAKASKNGYVYVYLSNETPNMPVYFDNLQVSQVRGPIVEDNAYYPFGLKIQGISAKAAGKIKAKEGYQGDYNEQDEETGYNEFDLRFYDPQIGRWLQVDPMGEYPNVYTGMGNDPVNSVDPDGGFDFFEDGFGQYKYFAGAGKDAIIPGYKWVGVGEAGLNGNATININGQFITSNVKFRADNLPGFLYHNSQITFNHAAFAETTPSSLPAPKVTPVHSEATPQPTQPLVRVSDPGSINPDCHCQTQDQIADNKARAEEDMRIRGYKPDGMPSWVRNKALNNFSERMVEPMFKMYMFAETGGAIVSLLRNGGLATFEVSSLRISQTLESNSEMKALGKLKSSIEQNGINYNLPFEDQIHVFQHDGVNYLVNGHNRLVVAQKLGINQLKGVTINDAYLMSRYRVTPGQLVNISERANLIGNRIRWYK